MPFTPRLLLVVTSTVLEARGIAHILLQKHLAACVNIVPAVESHYWWKGKLETAAEVLLLIKSSAEQFEQVREHVALHHSYECPEVMAINPDAIAPAYRAWWEQSLET